MWEGQPFMLMKIVPIGGEEVVIDLDEVTYNGSWMMGELTIYDNFEDRLFKDADKIFGEVFLNGRSMGQFDITNWETSIALKRCQDCSETSQDTYLTTYDGKRIRITPEDTGNTSIVKYTPKAKPKTVNDNTFTRLNTL
jgi:hypothetical protein